jgi:hypothetical protein
MYRRARWKLFFIVGATHCRHSMSRDESQNSGALLTRCGRTRWYNYRLHGVRGISMTGGSVFEPDATRAMALAFDGICGSLHVPSDARERRLMIAERVIELARDGEVDPAILYGRILRECIWEPAWWRVATRARTL